MSTSDCRTLNIYRMPMYQKRTPVMNNSLSNQHSRSPSPNQSVLVSVRRHSTPPPPVQHLVDVHSSPANTFVKYSHSQPRTIITNKEQNRISNDSIKSSSSRQTISLIKRRHQDDRFIRVVTTPTSVKSFTDVLLPVTKKNRSNVIETTATSIPSDMQATNRNLRGPMRTVNLESETCISNEDFDDKSFQENAYKFKSIRWCDARCPCQSSYCNFCHCIHFIGWTISIDALSGQLSSIGH